MPKSLQGIIYYYSNPKSPASVATKKLHIIGDIKLSDTLMGKNIMYDVTSFFQVNLPVFESVLSVIGEQVRGSSSVDMYSGVGTIGLAVGARSLVESDATNVVMARENARKHEGVKVIHAASEAALERITSQSTLIVDPPRAGLHRDVIDRIVEVSPPKVVYLSCNPSTQARDVKLLLDAGYTISYAQGYNFFPRTPHIENLVVLEKS
jgi:23S rRNA (uracil1939-C5)-methyltransferase